MKGGFVLLGYHQGRHPAPVVLGDLGQELDAFAPEVFDGRVDLGLRDAALDEREDQGVLVEVECPLDVLHGHPHVRYAFDHARLLPVAVRVSSARHRHRLCALQQ